MKLNFLGVPVYLNGRYYYVPSLAYLDLKQNYDLLTSAAPTGGAEFFAFVEKVVPVIALAMRRNYPDLSDQQILTWIDSTTLPLLLKAMAGQSGLEPVAEGE